MRVARDSNSSIRTCPIGSRAPRALLERLPESQGGHGRHECAVCAFVQGRESADLRDSAGLPPHSSTTETCPHGNVAPVALVSSLHPNQGGPERHKCAVCAYHAGRLDGLAILRAEDAIQTEARAHGLEGGEFVPAEEGKSQLSLHKSYERSARNRARAIQIHGTTCAVCGFSFDDIYTPEFAGGYIEVHHTRSITEGERIVDPETDLIPICSNCHAMVHRCADRILTVAELIALVARAGASRLT